jgi:AAA domain, putative AbiEii toxin, Type IV TA system
MWLKTIQLKNIKSFIDSGEIQMSKGINVLVGPNNSGKSAILKSAYLLQGSEGNAQFLGSFLPESIRLGAAKAEAKFLLADPEKRQLRCLKNDFDIRGWRPEFYFSWASNQSSITMRRNNPDTDTMPCNLPICAQREPDNFIYPYFSRRKPPNFDLAINRQNETVVEEVFTHLPAKIDRLSYPRHPGSKPFEQACLDSLQLQISTATHQNGKEAGLLLSDGTILPIDKMGEGTPGLLALLTHLCVAKGKLFLIEELENDLHPKALKALLDVIVAKSQDNQFVISTHSNIVVRILGSAPDARVFSLEMKLDQTTQIPTSTCTVLDGNPENRIRLLEDLGYQPSDLYLYDAYLVLEESTAERIIRDFIVPNMFPVLSGRLRTIAAGGVNKVEAYFEDFHRLFVFLHTSKQYHDRAWAAVDAGEEGQKVVARLQNQFKDWNKSRFRCFEKPRFEAYYPPQFKTEADQILAQGKQKDLRKPKGELAEKVLAWCLANPQEAKDWFTRSAPDVIALLKEIEEALVQ